MANALFVCLHNAGRSQMSEALFERAAEGRHGARSAGTTPGDRVHPEVVEAMREIGIDLADRVPRRLSRDDARWADVVVTMGCGDECPYIPGRRYVDWDLPDPKGRPLAEVRATREEIERRVGELVAELDAAPEPPPGSEPATVACGLDRAGVEERLARLRAVGAASLVEIERPGSGRALLRFRADGATRSSLEGIVAAERACCPFLDLELIEEANRIQLAIGSPAAGLPVLEELVAAFGSAHGS